MSHADDTPGTRRDFLFYATGGAAAVTTGAAVWPLINQMNPSADVLALSSINVDVSNVDVGTQITVKWLGKPVFIRRRADKEIEEAKAVSMDQLIDPIARNANIDPAAPATDVNRALPKFEGAEGSPEEWLVQIGVCTHLGCVPIGNGAGDYDGWFCPCHGSQYDSAGRVRHGPAPENLAIPPAKFTDANTIKLG